MTGLRAPLLVATALAAAVLAPAARAQMSSLDDLDREFRRVVERVAEAVVQVEPGISGVCISEQGYVLTDGLVAQAFARSSDGTVEVTFPDQSRYDARLLATDAATRTVVLAIDTRRRLPAVVPGDPEGLAVGHFLLTVGNAFGLASESEPAVTLGVVSAIHRDAQGRPVGMETSAATNPGQNGGPYFDTEGKLVGLARGLPDGQDLAQVTPIDRIREAYAGKTEASRLFERPTSLRPPRSKSSILSRAFHIAAMRARPIVCTLLIEREPVEATEAEAADAAAAEDDDGDDDRGEGNGRRRGRKKDAKEKAPPVIPVRTGPVTGTIVHPDGFVIAAGAPFGDDVRAVEAVLHDGRRYAATVVARDRKADLALLLLDKRPQDPLPSLGALRQDELSIGQFVVAVGAPHEPAPATDPFVTVGILSARHRLNAYLDALQTDAGVNVKNAGGALVDLRGRLIGVILPPSLPFGQNSGLGFAMPIDGLSGALTRLMKGQDNEPAYIGVVLGDAPGGGVLVNEVTAGFPGERAGLRAGDVITHLDGEEVPHRRALTDFLWTRKAAGDSMDVTLRRGDATLEVRVALTRRP
ncbi:MAG: S1C family serine protease [Planctomycetota bacterium JB042]